MSSSPFERKVDYSRGRSRFDQSSLKRFLSDDSMGSSLSSDSVEVFVDFGSMISGVESESSSVVKLESSIVGDSVMN